MKWLYKLEYKYGRYHIPGLMRFVVGGMVAVYVLAMAGVDIIQYLTLDLGMVARGQVWRLITFVFVPPIGGNAFWTFISLYFYYIIGSSLEQIWGGFRFTWYYVIGIVGAILGTLVCWFISPLSQSVAAAGSNNFLNLSLFLAFATVSPDSQFMLFFIIPVKAKWMALAYVALLAITIVRTLITTTPLAALMMLILLAFSLLNYALFLGRSLVETVQNQLRIYRNRRNWRNRNR